MSLLFVLLSSILDDCFFRCLPCFCCFRWGAGRVVTTGAISRHSIALRHDDKESGHFGTTNATGEPAAFDDRG
jgi:hypothetical protein